MLYLVLIYFSFGCKTSGEKYDYFSFLMIIPTFLYDPGFQSSRQNNVFHPMKLSPVLEEQITRTKPRSKNQNPTLPSPITYTDLFNMCNLESFCSEKKLYFNFPSITLLPIQAYSFSVFFNALRHAGLLWIRIELFK